MDSKNQTKPLTAFRFFAAIGVVLFHFSKGTSLAFIVPIIASVGPPMVTFFFVLSGFILTLAHYDDVSLSLREFWINRFARIAPVYFLALAIATYLTFGYTQLENAAALSLDIGFLQAWSPRYALAINGPGWSLSVEVFFYALFPILLIGLKRLRNQALSMAMAFWFATTLAIGYLISGSPNSIPDTVLYVAKYLPLTHLCSFTLGMAGALWLIDPKQAALVFRRNTAVVLIVVLLIALYLCLKYLPLVGTFHGLPIATSSSLLGPLFLAILIVTVRAERGSFSLLASPRMQLLGNASYAIYILQVPLNYIYERIVTRTLHLRFNSSIDAIVYTVVLTIGCVFVYKVIEVPAKSAIKLAVARLRLKAATLGINST